MFLIVQRRVYVLLYSETKLSYSMYREWIRSEDVHFPVVMLDVERNSIDHCGIRFAQGKVPSFHVLHFGEMNLLNTVEGVVISSRNSRTVKVWV